MAVRPDTTTKSAAPSPANTEEDLEQYGVWVKAEPQDIIEEPEDIPLAASDFDIPLGDSVQEEDSFLTEDEEKLLGSFEELDTAAEAPPKPRAESIEQFDMASSSIPDIENLPPLEDFEAKDDGGSDIEELGAATIDISLDDLEAPSPIRPDAKIDLHAVRGLEEKSETFSFGPSKASTSAPSSSIEDVSAEFLDFAESAEGGSGSDVTSEFLEGDSSSDVKERSAEPEPDFEPIDMELHFDDTINADASGSSHGEPGFEAVSEFDDFLQDEGSPAPAKEASFTPSHFDDVSAVEKELSEPPRAAEAPRRRTASESPVSNDLVAKIAQELSSIRSELESIKGQIGALKSEEGLAPTASESEHQKQKAAGGFFDEEEDETIALTGDELDNILNTADFTEESPGEAQESISVDLGSVSLDNESILPESGDYLNLNEGPAIEEIRLEPSSDGSAASLDEGLSDIDLMVDEGIQHLTQPPEDTSYLEEPLPNEEPLDLSEIPLHEESLVDDSKLDLGLDIEEMEPIPEISEELPVVETASERGSSAETLADITLGMEVAPDYLPGGDLETDVMEAIPEVEESSFADINLAEESLEPEGGEEVEELVSIEEDLTPFPMAGGSDADLAATIDARTVKPAQPISFHPDEIPMSLDDSFFVGGKAHGGGASTEELPEIEETAFEPPAKSKAKAKSAPPASAAEPDNDRLKSEIRGVLSYLDKLLESLPESKIDEFAHSEYFDTYKKLFEELGLV